eukprot:18497-Heterococcus_DN1.PRE.1
MTSIESGPLSAVAIQRLLPLTAAAQIGLQCPCMHAIPHNRVIQLAQRLVQLRSIENQALYALQLPVLLLQTTAIALSRSSSCERV